MIRNTWNSMDNNDNRFQIGVIILKIAVCVLTFCSIIGVVVTVSMAEEFTFTSVLEIIGILIAGIILYTLIEVIACFFLDIKFIRNSLMKQEKANGPDTDEPDDKTE